MSEHRFYVISALLVLFKGLCLNAKKNVSVRIGQLLAELLNFRQLHGRKCYYPNLRAVVAFPKMLDGFFLVRKTTFLSLRKQQLLHSPYHENLS